MTSKKLYRFISVVNQFKNRIEKLTNVNRKEAENIKRYLDEEENRVYEGPEAPEGVYSVTTILDRGSDDDKTGLKYWKKNNDGVGDNADWEDILHYKTNRGTLAHYAALNRFDHKFEKGDSMWTGDERSSQDAINDKSGNKDYVYSILKDKGYVKNREEYRILDNNEDVDLQEILTNDLEYVREEFDAICRDKSIKASTVEEVEAMFARPRNRETRHQGFGGQADLLYTCPKTGDHVVADIKTSKQIYQKHKYQVAAYAQAAKEDPELNGEYIDRCEIIRLNPDKEESEVYEIKEFQEYWEEFAEMTRKAYKS